MRIDSSGVARRIEIHESQAWIACVAASAATAGNPLKAEVYLGGNTPLSTLAALNFGNFNRVIAFGIEAPASDGDIVAVQEFFSARLQSRFLIEVTPPSRPESLAESLTLHGLLPVAERVAKCFRDLRDLPPLLPDIEVLELSPSDSEGWTAANEAAWGLPAFFGAWFGATLGCDGFRHYGVFDDGLLVSTGAIYVTDDVAWSGFSATRPEHRGRGYQTATHLRRLHDAAAMGCNLIHTETAAETPDNPNPSLRNQLKVGFSWIYDKRCFAPVNASTTA
jgi:GNAT superfamily N-acetyltransferase